MKSRRYVLKVVTASLVGLTIPVQASNRVVQHINQENTVIDSDAYFALLVRQDPRAFYFDNDSEQRNNFNTAWRKIQPTHFQEYAFITWCALRVPSVKHIINEYCARRDGNTNGYLPINKDLDVEHLFSLIKTQRLLIYREPRDMLFAELVGIKHSESFSLVNKYFYRSKPDYDIFRKLISSRWRETLSENNIEQLISEFYLTITTVLPLYYVASLTGNVLFNNKNFTPTEL